MSESGSGMASATGTTSTPAGGDRTYDVVVIGGGAVGENVADRAHRGGLRVAMVESELVGGECSYWACMPSKALLRPGAALAEARAVGGAAAAVTGGLDVAAVLERRNSFAAHWDDAGQVRWVEGAGIELVRGHGRLAGERRVEVTAEDGAVTTLTATHAVVVCTGSDPVIPPIPGLAEVEPWASREATSAQEVPTSLAVLGGGVVACEMALAYADLGARVTVLVRGPRVLAGLEPVASDLVVEGLRAAGVEVRLGVEAERVERVGAAAAGGGSEHGDGSARLHLADGSTLEVARVLVATGREPRSRDVGVHTVGLTPGEYLAVDETMLVRGVDGGWLYAVADVTGRAHTTHEGKYQARVAGDVIAARAAGRPVESAPWGKHAATADVVASPQVVFTRPEVAAVGLTEEQARAAGRSVRAVDYDLANVAGASLFADDFRGAARMVIDEERRVPIGFTFVGPQAAELLQAATIAVVAEVPLDRLWHAVPAYPTVSEVWLRLLETAGL